MREEVRDILIGTILFVFGFVCMIFTGLWGLEHWSWWFMVAPAGFVAGLVSIYVGMGIQHRENIKFRVGTAVTWSDIAIAVDPERHPTSAGTGVVQKVEWDAWNHERTYIVAFEDRPRRCSGDCLDTAIPKSA